MLTGYLTPIMKVIPSGGGTGADLWTLYQYTTISFIAGGLIIVFLGTVYLKHLYLKVPSYFKLI